MLSHYLPFTQTNFFDLSFRASPKAKHTFDLQEGTLGVSLKEGIARQGGSPSQPLERWAPGNSRQQEGTGQLREQAGGRHPKRKQEGSEDRLLLHSLALGASPALTP